MVEMGCKIADLICLQHDKLEPILLVPTENKIDGVVAWVAHAVEKNDAVSAVKAHFKI
jgi:hypothetical protein